MWLLPCQPLVPAVLTDFAPDLVTLPEWVQAPRWKTRSAGLSELGSRDFRGNGGKLAVPAMGT